MVIDQLLQSWSDDKQRQPPIISQTWHGTRQSALLVDLWGQQYARAYGWMLALGVTSQLWHDFGDWACAEFPKGIVFDAGVGQGNIAKKLLDTCPETSVVGGDWSIPFLQRAQKNLAHPSYKGRIALCQMDLTQPWPDEWDGAFDGVISNFVAAYLPIETQKTLLAEAFRVLRPGGVLLFNFMLQGVEFRQVVKNNVREELRRNPFVLLRGMLLTPIFTKKVDRARDTQLIQSFTQQEFEEAAQAIGFRQVEIAGWHLPLSAGHYAVPTYRLVK